MRLFAQLKKKTSQIQKLRTQITHRKGDNVILKDDTMKRLFQKLAIVQELPPRKDGTVRAAILKVGTANEEKRAILLKRSTQRLYPIEVHSD